MMSVVFCTTYFVVPYCSQIKDENPCYSIIFHNIKLKVRAHKIINKDTSLSFRKIKEIKSQLSL